MKIEELTDRDDETGLWVRETLNVLLEPPYFYLRFRFGDWLETEPLPLPDFGRGPDLRGRRGDICGASQRYGSCGFYVPVVQG